ncbi:MAG: HAMP domain-containing histidine kinase [candidate division Zixibacteria bacterium]|nr:HAMP domain-containing histidine kinase [candidate division Zixibacteria bacterium]
MNIISQKENALREQGFAFYGKITASLSHELNNVIAIINEYNGLLNDLLIGAKQGVPIDDKKLQKISKKNSIQLERGKELVDKLNKFAHSSDNAAAEIDISEILQAIIALTQRLAGLKEINLEFKALTEPIKLVNNPFCFQHAVFTCFEMFIANDDISRSIIVSAEKIESMVIIKISGSELSDNAFNQTKKSILEMLLEQLNGSYRITAGDGGRQIIILTIDRKADTKHIS